MKPLLLPSLVNEPFGDPALYIDFLFERRALLFDLGDLGPLAPRKILRLSHVFVSHTHMDHFSGLDRLLRTCLGRERELRLFGPPGFIEQAEHKLAGYTWNLVPHFSTTLTLVVTEVEPEGTAHTTRFCSREGFRRHGFETSRLTDGILVDEEGFRVRSAFLDHQIPCLAFAIEETAHVNVWKNRLGLLGIPAGPWLAELKKAILRGEEDEAEIQIRWRAEGQWHEVSLPVGLLRDKAVHVSRGQKITYVVDAVYNSENAQRIVELARDSDILFIETPFLDAESERAARKFHLTARQAGLLARQAGVRLLVPFHFSPKYSGQGERLAQEAQQTFELGVSGA